MLIRTYDNADHDLSLLSVNGDRIGVDSLVLIRLVMSWRFVATMIGYVFIKSIISQDVFGVTVTWFSALSIWYVYVATAVLTWLGLYWAIEQCARLLRRKYHLITIPLHVIALAATMPIARGLALGETTLVAMFQPIAPGIFLFEIISALLVELFLVAIIWPIFEESEFTERSRGIAGITSFQSDLRERLADTDQNRAKD